MDSKNKNKQATPSHICEIEDGGSHASSDHQTEKKKRKKRCCSACVCFEFDVAPFAFLMILLIAISAFVTRGDQWSLFAWRMNRGVEEVGISTYSNVPSKDKLLGGLLSEEFDEESCKSRYESMFFTNASYTHKPSPYLIERLRKYEELHKRCGPNTELYNKAIDQLKSGNNTDDQQSECKYLINQPNSGLGNRMITLASSFLYALLSNRVLLTESGKDISDLLCEPFPQSSWLLSPDFPLYQLHHLRFGNIVKEYSTRNSSSTIPSYVFLDLSHASTHNDKLFFCDEVQHDLVNNITWIITASNQYFLPAFFLMPSYREELNLLFPEKDTVFHHLGRYLFHPTNSVWGLITRYYSSYLSNAEQRLGIQIRVFNPLKSIFLKEKTPPELVLDQIISCALKEKLLPNVSTLSSNEFRMSTRSSKSVLITSLKSEYFESIRNMYWEKATVDGEIISVYQPSHEEHQQTEKSSHDMKALAEIYLLSYSNVLVTSSLSTFGYVAQSLGGMKPWILTRPDHYKKLPEIPCTRALSMEPCYHAPGTYDCRAKKDIDFGLVVDHVRHCEDASEGLKLIGEDA